MPERKKYPPYEAGPWWNPEWEAGLDLEREIAEFPPEGATPSPETGGSWTTYADPSGRVGHTWIPKSPLGFPQEPMGVGQPFTPSRYYQPRYERAWGQQLARAEPSVSRPRYSWMERMFPKLMSEWEAKQAETTAEFAQRQRVRAGGVLRGIAGAKASPMDVPILGYTELNRLRRQVGAREKSFAEFTQKYPFEREWGKGSPYERGYRWQYQRPIRKVSY